MTNADRRIVWTSIEDLFDKACGRRPSALNLEALKKIENGRTEARDFIERAVRLMAIARFSPQDIVPSLAWTLGVMIPELLPRIRANTAPPMTVGDRHRRINRYLDNNPWTSFPDDSVLLEMGCGFPPITALDAARDLPQWQVIGADLQFDPYILYDPSGNYACLDSSGSVRYFQATGSATSRSFYNDASPILRQFRELFEELRPKLPSSEDNELVSIVHDGFRLVRNPIKSFERDNLRFVQLGIGAETPQADVVRIFNLLYYFDAQFRSQAEEWVLRTLRPGGLFLCGGDGPRTQEARYSTYRHENGALVRKEFAFSLDNLRPLTPVPWFCLHDGEKETFELARLVGVIRSDERFRHDYDSRLDELLAEKRLWLRQDGFLVAPPNPLPTTERDQAREVIEEQLDNDGFTDHAVSILKDAGYSAWRNTLGHISILPGVGGKDA